MFGYWGKIALVDLSKRKIKYYNFKEEFYRKIIGGRGLGAYFFYHLIRPKIDPLSPENVIILASGPLNGTMTPLASKIGFFFKSPLTTGWGESYVGGTLPPALAWSKLDALIIKGRSEEPVYLHINEENIEILEAKDLWGRDVYYTEDYLKEIYGKKAIIASIGQAGENLVRFAAIMNNKWRAAGRSGGGAVFGSKKLKALVFTGEKKYVNIKEPEKLRSLLVEIAKTIRDSDAAKGLREFGTAGLTILANEMGFFPTAYWSRGRMKNWERIGAHSIKEILVKVHPCYNCPIACGRYVKIQTKWGEIELDGLEYESVDTLGGQLLLDDLGAVTYLNELADKYGLDTISLGNVLGFAVEAHKRGKIKTRVNYGDGDAFVKLVQDIVFRKGDGDILAEGVARASKTLGLEDIAVHVKGQEPPAYDPRRLKGMIVGLGTSVRGACHLRMMAYYIDLKKLGGGPEVITEEKMNYMVDFEDYLNAFDSLIVCKFGRNIFTWENMTAIFNAVTGFDFSINDFKLVNRRINALIRLINAREGFTRKDDRLPKRLLREPLKNNGDEYRITEEEMEKYLDMYYEKRGYDKNGIPTEETLKKLGVLELTKKPINIEE